MTSPFDYVNAINAHIDVINDNPDLTPRDAIRQYSPFFTNRALSYHPDAINSAHLMNINSQLDPKMQFDFLISTVRPRTRCSKWAKPVPNADIDTVMTIYKCSRNVAKQYLRVLTTEDIAELNEKLQKGGSDG